MTPAGGDNHYCGETAWVWLLTLRYKIWWELWAFSFIWSLNRDCLLEVNKTNRTHKHPPTKRRYETEYNAPLHTKTKHISSIHIMGMDVLEINFQLSSVFTIANLHENEFQRRCLFLALSIVVFKMKFF